MNAPDVGVVVGVVDHALDRLRPEPGHGPLDATRDGVAAEDADRDGLAEALVPGRARRCPWSRSPPGEAAVAAEGVAGLDVGASWLVAGRAAIAELDVLGAEEPARLAVTAARLEDLRGSRSRSCSRRLCRSTTSPRSTSPSASTGSRPWQRGASMTTVRVDGCAGGQLAELHSNPSPASRCMSSSSSSRTTAAIVDAVGRLVPGGRLVRRVVRLRVGVRSARELDVVEGLVVAVLDEDGDGRPAARGHLRLAGEGAVDDRCAGACPTGPALGQRCAEVDVSVVGRERAAGEHHRREQAPRRWKRSRFDRCDVGSTEPSSRARTPTPPAWDAGTSFVASMNESPVRAASQT